MYNDVIDRWATRVVYILEQGYRGFREANNTFMCETSHACDGGEVRDAHVSGSERASQGAAATRKACIVDLADFTSLGSSQNAKNTLPRSHRGLSYYCDPICCGLSEKGAESMNGSDGVDAIAREHVDASQLRLCSLRGRG